MVRGKLFHFLCVSAILLVLATEGLSAVYRISNSEDPEHPGFCYYKDSNSPQTLLLKPGTSKKHPSQCSQVNCGNNFGIIIHTCGTMRGPENCVLVKNINDPYPECCGKFVCPE